MAAQQQPLPPALQNPPPGHAYYQLPMPLTRGAPTLPDKVDYDTIERFFQLVERVCAAQNITDEQVKKSVPFSFPEDFSN